MNKKERKLKFGALDVFIILVVIVCAVSIVLRYVSNKQSDVGASTPLENYVISFEVLDIKDTSAQNYLEPGTNFYLVESDVLLGTLREGITVRDAEKYYEMPNGDIVLAQNNATGDLYRVDVEGSFDAKGRVDSSGRFLLGGNTYIGINKEVKIYSKYLAVTVVITGITNAGQ
ncbi:MAG: DUF4330 family protein [Ruminococcaceae bacterium]|nr:DUF4330 family protein [Oscillospiraceae bacterium]